MFILRGKETLVVTDHKSLLGILNKKEINNILDSRLQSLKNTAI